jgi:hypothetical protein
MVATRQRLFCLTSAPIKGGSSALPTVDVECRETFTINRHKFVLLNNPDSRCLDNRLIVVVPGALHELLNFGRRFVQSVSRALLPDEGDGELLRNDLINAGPLRQERDCFSAFIRRPDQIAFRGGVHLYDLGIIPSTRPLSRRPQQGGPLGVGRTLAPSDKLKCRFRIGRFRRDRRHDAAD